MHEELIELAVHLFGALLYTSAGVLLTGAGVFLEYQGYLFISNGEGALAAWMGLLGVLLFVFGFLVLRDKARGEWSEMRA